MVVEKADQRKGIIDHKTKIRFKVDSSFDIIKSKYSIISSLANTVTTVLRIEFEQQAIL